MSAAFRGVRPVPTMFSSNQASDEEGVWGAHRDLLGQ